MMTMKPEDLRQLRSWAVATVLAKMELENRGSELPVKIPMSTVIAESRKLVNFVRGN